MKKVITWIIILAVIAGGVWGGFWWRGQRAQSQSAAGDVLRTGQVTRGELVISVPASGNVAVNRKVNLSFKLPGNVTTVAVAVSDQVKAGQELARLDTTALKRAVRQAEIALEQARLNLTTLQKPAGEEDIRLAELAIQNAAQALEVARLSKEAAEAQASLSIRSAQDAADKLEEQTKAVDRLDQMDCRFTPPVSLPPIWKRKAMSASRRSKPIPASTDSHQWLPPTSHTGRHRKPPNCKPAPMPTELARSNCRSKSAVEPEQAEDNLQHQPDRPLRRRRRCGRVSRRGCAPTASRRSRC